MNGSQNNLSSINGNNDRQMVGKAEVAPAPVRSRTTAYEYLSTRLREFVGDAWIIGGNAIPMAASYTFSIEQVAVGVIALKLNNSQEYAAASVLAQTIMATSVRISLAPLFAISLHLSPLFGQLRSIEDDIAAMQRNRDIVANGGVIEFDEEMAREGVRETIDQKLARLKAKRLEIGNTLKAGLIKSLIVALPPFLVLYFSKEMLLGFGQAAEVADLAASFLRPYSVSSIALSVRMALGQVMYSKGDTKPSMYIGLAAFAASTALSVWLAFGGFGVESLGLEGIAWGYTIEAYFTALAYAGYIFTSNKYSNLPLLSLSDCAWKDVRGKLGKLVEIATPVTITMIVESAMTFVLSVFAGLRGVQDQAALSYSMQIVFLMFVGLMAFGQATAHEVGRRKGAQNYVSSSQAAVNGLMATMVAVIPPCLVVSIAPNLLYGVLGITDPQTQAQVRDLVPIVSAGAIAQSARYNVNQVLRVLGDHKGSTVISVAGMGLGVALAGVLGLETGAGLYAIAAGLMIGEGVSCLGLLFHWCTSTRPEVIERVAADPNSAEPKTWGEYIRGLLGYASVGSEPAEAAQPRQEVAAQRASEPEAWSEYIGSFFGYTRGNREATIAEAEQPLLSAAERN